MTDHEVYHGDCFERLAALPDRSVDLILTDPPYGHRNNDGDLIARWESVFGGSPAREEARPIDNDGEEANELVRRMFAEAARVLKPGSCCCCCCCGGGPDPQFARWSLWMGEPLNFVQMVVWDKGPMGMGHRYRRSYEVMLVGTRKGGKMPWYDESKKIENIIRPGDYGIRKIIPSAEQHPTQKPVALFELFVRLHTKPGDLVVDPFCGSGSSGVAAKKLGRRWLGCDTDERWVKMARERLAATTPPLPGLEYDGGDGE